MKKSQEEIIVERLTTKWQDPSDLIHGTKMTRKQACQALDRACRRDHLHVQRKRLSKNDGSSNPYYSVFRLEKDTVPELLAGWKRVA